MTSRTTDHPDGGWGWVCVMGKLYCYFFLFGTTTAFGIIYIDLIEYFNSSREVTAWIGSLSGGLMFLTGPLSSVLMARFGIQKTTAAGTLLAFSGCFISWFANGIPYLYVSYGAMMGLGLGLIVVPCNYIVVQYFEARRGLAVAIGSVGNGLGSLILPLLYLYLLEEYGWRGTLLILSGIVLNGLVCAVIFEPPPYLRSPKTTQTSTQKSFSCKNYVSVCSPTFVIYTTGVSIVFLGYFVPFVHLPDLVIQIGIDKTRAASLVSIMGVSSVAGRIVFGWISDFQCVNIIVLQGVSLMICGVVIAACPHLIEFYALAVYAVIYGTFIGVYSTEVPLVYVKLVGAEITGDALGIFFFIAGVFDIVASPIAGWLFDTTHTYNISFYVAASSFILGGLMTMVVTVLHGRQIKQKAIDHPNMDAQPDSRCSTTEKIRM